MLLGLALGVAGCRGQGEPTAPIQDSDHDLEAERDAEADGPAQPGEPDRGQVEARRIEELPFLFRGDTSALSAGRIDSYDCGLECCDPGREARFSLELAEAAVLRARVTAAAGAELHLHLLRRDTTSSCIEGGLPVIDRPLPPGGYELIVDGPAGGEGAFDLEVFADEPTPRLLGTMWNTFYILADEGHYVGPQTTWLLDDRCQPITKVRRAFYNALCIQGSGVLDDGRVVNYSSHCTRRCPRAQLCRRFPVRICYTVLDPERYPHGMGKAPRPLVPDWSAAVDPSFVPLDSVLYLEELDGVVPPGKVTPHDGCVGAVDTGGGIDDDHIDLFAGARERWLAWEKLLPTRTRFHVWVDHPRCFRYRLRPDGDISSPP